MKRSQHKLGTASISPLSIDDRGDYEMLVGAIEHPHVPDTSPADIGVPVRLYEA